jgi:hypothetical protein
MPTKHMPVCLRYTGFNHCQIKWDGCKDSRSNVIMHDNSTNGTWYMSFAPTPPSLILPTPTVFKTCIHMRSLTPIPHVCRSMMRASPKENCASCMMGTRSRLARRCSSKSWMKTTSSSTGNLAPKELTGIDTKYNMAHELGCGMFVTVIKVMAHNVGEWWAIKTIRMQKLCPSNNNNSNKNDGSGTGPSRRNGCRSPTTSMKNLEREVNILVKLNHPNICCLHEMFPPNKGGNGYCEFFL